ncbi:hypothetical protein A9B99_03350 [Mangrovibacter phragmitis]|uniref:GGDEF domain-containing protein n=1 Tax=Mangrovibacter phragmitis TaxID=1691903 RepID=A0A1B7L8T1_9ENTR|nr:GGDEF domain-containing protein [Mangrovibacter phragmitis]OAT78752.1 hypothetical protein A9B99_03350 [Mangrovibacter phragmitis]
MNNFTRGGVTLLHADSSFIKELMQFCSTASGLHWPWVMVLDRESAPVTAPGSAPLCHYHIISGDKHTAWQQVLSGQTLREGIYCLKELSGFYSQFPELEVAGMCTHLSVPVILRDGTLYGSVNSVSKQNKQDSQVTVARLVSLAKIIARYAEELLVIEQLKEDNYQLALHSYTDSLTQLPNRRAIFDRLPALFSLAKRINRTVLISYIDLDEFKKINDDLGHDTGDALLKEIGQRLHHIVREEDIVGRIGGDEFLLACLGPEKETDQEFVIRTIKDRIHTTLRGQYTFGNLCLWYEGASAGVVCVSPENCSVDDAVKLADTAMYKEKKPGGRADGPPPG